MPFFGISNQLDLDVSKGQNKDILLFGYLGTIN